VRLEEVMGFQGAEGADFRAAHHLVGPPKVPTANTIETDFLISSNLGPEPNALRHEPET